MSILMDALKQQSALPTQSADGSVFWRRLALVLALLVALLSGALLAYWLQPAKRSVSEQSTQLLQPEVAAPAQILAVLNTASAETKPTAVTAQPAEAVKAPVSETLPEQAKVKTVTVTEAETQSAVAAQTEETLPDMQVSDELRDKFSQALKATEQPARNTTSIRTHDAPAQDISMLDSQLLRQIPPLRFDAHVYATSAAQRWVKVNGKTLQEGQWVTSDIRIREITPQYVLLELGNQLFSMAALTEWPAN